MQRFDRCAALLGALATLACGGQPPQEEMRIHGDARPAAVVASGAAAQARAALTLASRSGVPGEAKQILFGDLHVHTTLSYDAYMFSLPLLGGDGVHPPADACDFARYCSNLDFFSATDHAESMRQEHWELSKRSVRECNARAGDPSNPDVVAFAGFEWSQAGLTPEEHFGHRCLVFPEQDDAKLPARPIGSGDRREGYVAAGERIARARFTDPLHWRRYTDYVDYTRAMLDAPLCDDDLPTTALESGCVEVAETPRELHRKLDEWGGEVLEIPHGMAWGVYTPATTSIAKHLEPEFYDPKRQKLIEIMSGHGNSEEYRSWREWETSSDGEAICPEPTPDHLSCCWQAGEIMRSRCGDLPSEECERRVELARAYAMEAYTRPHSLFPDAAPEEWLDCDQCRDCFKPSYAYRPLESTQYAMALTRSGTASRDAEPVRFRYGFVASSDEHSGRPGVGYKAVNRGLMTDVNDVGESAIAALLSGASMDDPRMPVRPTGAPIGLAGNDGRVQSFLYPGGLAAVHAASRSREALWDAMQRREVYGTSGPRILLWFDLLNAPDGSAPMGSEVAMRESPRFEVRAAGSFEPKPGCPDWAAEGLGAERLAALCQGECHHPSETRRPIQAIEIVRILPQTTDGESVDPLIQDPWLRFECDADPAGCVVTFEDAEYASLGRDALYYARALEEARPAILGNPLRTRFDGAGNATAIDPCDTSDDCLDPVQERAWSSPIFVDFE
jgi:hypothetical protein